jgi:hypothetical protein
MVKNLINFLFILIIYLSLATSGSDSTKTNTQQKHEQLHLALQWNRVDIAKNYIMKNDRDWEVRISNNVLFENILLNRILN